MCKKFSVCNIHLDSHSGGILIEFSFSIPILIILLFFLCDHYRFFELRDKLKASAYLVASMVQQITNTRVDKQINRKDLNRIAYASCLNLFHTRSMFNPWPFGVYPTVTFTFVKRQNSNQYSYYRFYHSTAAGRSTTDSGMYSIWDTYTSSNKTQNEIAAIHTDLICNKDGDERLLINAAFGATALTKYSKEKLGFFIFNPKVSDFSYKVVITPKPGIFPPPAW